MNLLLGRHVFTFHFSIQSRIWDLMSGFQLRSLEQESSLTAVFSYCNDTCLFIVSYSFVVAQNAQSEVRYYTEYHSSNASGKSSDMAPNKQHLVMCSDEEIFIFNTSVETPVSRLDYYLPISICSFGHFCQS